MGVHYKKNAGESTGVDRVATDLESRLIALSKKGAVS